MTTGRVLLHLAVPGGSARTALAAYAYRRGFRAFVLDQRPDPGTLGGPDSEIYWRENDRLFAGSTDGSSHAIVRIGTAEALSHALESVATGDVLVVEWTDDRVIPLENLVAGRRERFHLWTVARTVRDVPSALGALEHGADRVIVPVRTTDEVDAVERTLETELPFPLAWTLVPVESVEPAGPGDRVLVDTTSLLAPEEGLVVGSAAAFLFHVRSEALGSRFSRPRPFRVNAGAAHSYVLMADGTTRYLSELEAGDRLLACRPDGGSRTVRVGRLKVERRPLVLLKAAVDGRTRTVFLQEAETVRLSAEGGAVSTSDPGPRFRTWGVALPPGRHLGTAVEESVEER